MIGDHPPRSRFAGFGPGSGEDIRMRGSVRPPFPMANGPTLPILSTGKNKKIIASMTQLMQLRFSRGELIVQGLECDVVVTPRRARQECTKIR